MMFIYYTITIKFLKHLHIVHSTQKIQCISNTLEISIQQEKEISNKYLLSLIINLSAL